MPSADQLSAPVLSDAALFRARLHPRGLLSRVFFLALLFASELLVISISLDSSSLTGAIGFADLIHRWGPAVLRAIVGVSSLFGTFLWMKNRAALERISHELEEVPLAWGLFGFHAVAMAAFAGLSWKLYSGTPLTAVVDENFLAGGWFIAGSAGIAFGALAMLPWKFWRKLLATGGRLWMYASIAILLAVVAGNFSRYLWRPASYATFTLVQFMLRPFVAGLFADPARLQLGTPRFHVIIAPECSGLEGAGLILAFGLIWLLVFRRECRFPQSLALVPAGIVVLFLLNAVRIAALIVIGDAGAEQIALGGFHSQAGWILFNVVAVGFCIIVRRVAWFTNPTFAGVGVHDGFASGFARESEPGIATAPNRAEILHPAFADNPTAAYLLPFLAILAAGMLATAASAGFEWLYALRMIAAGAALWIFRKSYASLNWRISWVGVASGVVVFLAWIALDRMFGGAMREQGPPAALLAASPLIRNAWIALRALAAVVTVPLAEELAFRGFLMRRFVSVDFESVSAPRVTWFALIASSVLFGVLHGGLWIAGIFAGLVFAWVWKRRGSMGDAVAAHASANALLAAYVLFYGQWHLW